MLRMALCFCDSSLDQRFLYKLQLHGVLHCLVVKCLTHNPGDLDSSHTGSVWFMEFSLTMTIQSPGLVLVKPSKDMNNVSCHRDMTEILFKET